LQRSGLSFTQAKSLSAGAPSMAETRATTRTTTASRPLSPHLSVYRPTLTMTMSILHRITGAALYAGTLILAWWLLAAASDAASFVTVAGVLNSWFGRLVLFGFSWALFHHMLGGLRHFVWDMGRGLDHPEREYLALATLIGGLALTVLVWAIFFLAH
jgi:succinate dehydrogenase / fumarate reductase, cytochrome b subunit